MHALDVRNQIAGLRNTIMENNVRFENRKTQIYEREAENDSSRKRLVSILNEYSTQVGPECISDNRKYLYQ